jgi:hypothetical protein
VSFQKNTECARHFETDAEGFLSAKPFIDEQNGPWAAGLSERDGFSLAVVQVVIQRWIDVARCSNLKPLWRMAYPG